jgi:hypothetical protein
MLIAFTLFVIVYSILTKEEIEIWKYRISIAFFGKKNPSSVTGQLQGKQ